MFSCTFIFFLSLSLILTKTMFPRMLRLLAAALLPSSAPCVTGCWPLSADAASGRRRRMCGGLAASLAAASR